MRIYSAIALIAISILLAVILPQSMFPLACILAIASLHWERSLMAAFFALAAAHVIGGYFIAYLGQDSIYWLFNQHQFWFAQASLTIALGLFSMSTAYRMSHKTTETWINRLAIDEDRLRLAVRVIVLIAAGAMFYIYSGLSIVDLALENLSQLGKLRYLGGESASDVYWIARASDALVCTLPLLWLLKKGKLDYLIYAFGFLALIPPLRRAAIFSVLLLPFLVQTRQVNYRKVAVTFLILLCLYVVSQVYFLQLDQDETLTAVASALPEARDLGWVMQLLGSHYLYGATFIQPFDPVPAFIDTWKETHSMGYITATLLGLDPDERTFGGLRVTLAGEAFMNFWLFGPVIFGLLLGYGAAWARRSMDHARTLPIRYLAVTAFIWICLWLYMGGTQAVATLKFELVVLVVVYFAARKRTAPATDVALQPAASSAG